MSASNFFAGSALMLAATFTHAASIVFDYQDDPGEGFFDETSVSAAPGNSGTTLGQQRRNLVEAAAAIWAAELTSDVPITVRASFASLSCSGSGGTLAQAGTIGIYNNFPGAPQADVNYPQALANALAGQDVDAGEPEISLSVNTEVDRSASSCFTNSTGFYYGTTGSPAAGEIPLLPTLLHELSHGLGFSSFIDSSGRFLGDRPGIFDLQAFDTETQAYFDDMSLQQRSIAARNDPFLVWTGSASNSLAANLLENQRAIIVTAPGSIAGTYAAADAPSTDALPNGGVSGEIVLVVDDNGRLNDGCDTLENTAELEGNIAMILRSSSCNWFDVAFRLRGNNVNVLALLVANNNGDEPADVLENFSNPPEDFVPSVGVGENLFDAVAAQSAAVNASVSRDPSQKTGTQAGFIRLYAPSGYSSGSSVSHWTVDTSPDLLMEPNQGDVALDGLDITAAFMRDLGWPSEEIFENGFER